MVFPTVDTTHYRYRYVLLCEAGCAGQRRCSGLEFMFAWRRESNVTHQGQGHHHSGHSRLATPPLMLTDAIHTLLVICRSEGKLTVAMSNPV